MKVRRESVQTRSETGTRSREALSTVVSMSKGWTPRLPVTASYPCLQKKLHVWCGLTPPCFRLTGQC